MTSRRTFIGGAAAMAAVLGATGVHAQDATPAPDQACPVLTPEEMAALGADWARAWGTTDTAYFTEMVGDGYVHNSAGLHSVLGDEVPLEVFLDQVEAWRAGFEDFDVQLDFAVVQDNYVGYRFTMTGTHTGEFYGIPATDREIVDSGITVVHVECGKVVESWGAWDRGDFLGQLGQVEIPAALVTEAAATPEGFVEGVCAPATPDEAIAATERYWEVVWDTELTDPAQLDGVTSLYIEEHLPYQVELVGQDALVSHVAMWKTAMPDMAVSIDKIFSDGMHAVTVWSAIGTPTGPFLDYPGNPDAEPVTWRGINIFRINCGRIEEVWSEFDMYRLYQAMTGES